MHWVRSVLKKALSINEFCYLKRSFLNMLRFALEDKYYFRESYKKLSFKEWDELF